MLWVKKALQINNNGFPIDKRFLSRIGASISIGYWYIFAWQLYTELQLYMKPMKREDVC